MSTVDHKHDDQRSFVRLKNEKPFRRGDFKYMVLHYIKHKPSHGYEIMRELQERFNSCYIPSPGSVYPTLQMLDEMGYVTASEQEGKRVYTITEEGRRYLDEEKEFEERMWGQINNWWNPENIDDIGKTMREFDRLAQLLRDNVRTADVKKLNRIREILARAYEEISKDKV